MARGPRICPPGLTQHAVQRGNNRGLVFRDATDYRLYLWLLRHESERCAVAVHAYALMPNHVHLMLTPEDPTGVSEMMQAVGRVYVPRFNHRHERTGGLWEGRYRSFAIENENYWLTCMRYVELNPVRAGLVTSPDEYPWSSARVHTSGRSDPLVTPHTLYKRLGSTPSERQQAWRAMCREGTPDHELAELRVAIRTSRLTGSEGM